MYNLILWTHVDNCEKRKKRAAVITRVVYPFAVVKPGGREGDVTLNDINERILMPPTRPVKHPVGDFACRPCVSPHGPGLSGKAVVALTKIQTQGRGTITIIRTKGWLMKGKSFIINYNYITWSTFFFFFSVSWISAFKYCIYGSKRYVNVRTCYIWGYFYTL